MSTLTEIPQACFEDFLAKTGSRFPAIPENIELLNRCYSALAQRHPERVSQYQSVDGLLAVLKSIEDAHAVQFPVPEPIAAPEPEPEPEIPQSEPENPLAAAQTLREAIAIQERIAIETRERYQRARKDANANLGQSEGQRRYNETFERVRTEQFGGK
jgi:hypothetical protein